VHRDRHERAAEAGVPALQLTEASLRRDGRAVLDRVSLTVQAGERWVVLGPNGSGKTSLLQLASAHELPSAGEVRVLGERLGGVDVRWLRRRIGYASSALERLVPPRTPVRELVVTGKHGTLRTWRDPYEAADWKRADELLAQMGLAGRGDQRVETLSEGERRRVHLARSLMSEPELLLLDEPTAGLDLGGREDLVARLSELAEAGPEAIVFVTHHVEEIPPGFDHAALLQGGGLLVAGPLERVLTAEALSECVATPLTLERRGERFFAWRA
jgi:iron complex transport system ATP-binding protein